MVNVKSKNHECFRHVVTAAAYQRKKTQERVDDEIIENSKEFDWIGVKFLATFKDISRFESQNKYANNVYGYDKVVYLLRISEKVEESNKINLFLITNEAKNHYC